MKCNHAPCDNESREGSSYCDDTCRKAYARARYAERGRQAKAADADSEAELSAAKFEEVAGRMLESRVPIPQPQDKVLAVEREDMGFDSVQTAVACFSDYHFGGVVDTRVTGGIGGYDVKTARERLGKWRDGVLRFTQIMQLTTKVPELHILANGDDMEGNGHMFGTQALQMEISAHFQYLGFVADMTEVLVSLLSRFEKIHIYKVFGNHGRMSGNKKESYDPDNIELMAWETIAARCELAAPGRFTFDISTSFFQMVDILGTVHFQRHGDGVNLNSTYTGIVDNKLAFNSIVGFVIPVMVIGHHHTATEREEEIDGDTISNGCFVGPSLLALKMRRPRANRPSQEIWFVHPKKGITHRSRIHLATAEEVRNITVVKR